MTRREGLTISCVCALCALSITAGAARGGMILESIADDQDEGTAVVSGSQVFSGGDWSAYVDYAVYAPDDYPGTHVDQDDSYIYAYQVFNEDGSASTLGSLTVGLGDGSGVANPGSDGTYGPSGETPDLARLLGSPPTSAQWVMSLDATENSEILLFSSPNSYTWDSATLANGGQGDTQSLPSPVPEPTTLCLVALGALGLARRRAKLH